MRYHYEKPFTYQISNLDICDVYTCNHPVYSLCTLFKKQGKGLAVIQQRYDPATKRTWWGEIDPWLIPDLLSEHGFPRFFEERAGVCKDGLYPTVSIRQIMWRLRMKPLKKERWETMFDRKDI